MGKRILSESEGRTLITALRAAAEYLEKMAQEAEVYPAPSADSLRHHVPLAHLVVQFRRQRIDVLELVELLESADDITHHG
jgi:hypothetical protein